MFRIKICGITNSADALAAEASGADAVGLNFYTGSKRFLPPGKTRDELIARIPAGIARVGVFVNAGADEIVAISEIASLDWIQLHGDEPPVLLYELRAKTSSRYRIIRAFPFGAIGLCRVEDYLGNCRNLECLPDAVLIDAPAPAGQFGGTGNVVNWQTLAEQRSMLENIPLILAGGLTPENVAQAIRTVRPDAVDTASGVEFLPGVKDIAKTRSFCAVARAAFDS